MRTDACDPKKKMRVAIVLDSLARGGAERQALLAVRELTRQGCDVELIYYRRVDDAYEAPSPEQAKVTYLPKRGDYVRFLLRLGRYFRERAFDVVHGFKSSPTLYACIAGRRAGVPVVLGGMRAEYDETGLIRLGHRWVNRIADGWIVNSHATVGSMVEQIGANPLRVFVVHNGIDPAAFCSSMSPAEAKAQLGIDAPCPVVSIFAAIRPQKNHGLFLEAAAGVAKVVPRARFLVVGDGEGRGELERRVRDLHVADRVLFLGCRTDVPMLLAATDVSVLTSHYEGLANALLEAMAVGKPVVSTAYAGVEELVSPGREGFVVPLGDREAMTARIIELLADEPLRRRLGAQGARTVAERFSVEAMGRNLLEVYRGCLERVTVWPAQRRAVQREVAVA